MSSYGWPACRSSSSFCCTCSASSTEDVTEGRRFRPVSLLPSHRGVMPKASSLSSALHLLHRASQRADGLFTRNVGSGITPRQFAILQAVSERNGLSQTDIMVATGIDRSGTADLVRRLVRNGSLQRRRSRRDARLYVVRITAQGREKLEAGIPAAEASDRQLLQPLSASQRSTFLEWLALLAT